MLFGLQLHWISPSSLLFGLASLLCQESCGLPSSNSLIQHQCLVLFSQRTTGLSSKLYHKIAPRHIPSLEGKERAITQEFLKIENKKGKHTLSFKSSSSFLRWLLPRLSFKWTGEHCLLACPLRKDNPIVNTICTSKNIWMVIHKQLLSFQDH